MGTFTCFFPFLDHNAYTIPIPVDTLICRGIGGSAQAALVETRNYVSAELQKRGFTVTASQANFLFAKSDRIDGETLYRRLREKGVLIRHFTKERIKDYNRITIGSREEMEIFLQKTDEILEELT